jgi:hypothetical protein
VISGATFTQEMYDECREINRLYAAEVSRIMSRKGEIDRNLAEAEAEYETARRRDNKKARDAARGKRNAARLASLANRERTKDELKALLMLVRKWADSKDAKDDRRGWCQAMHTVVCGGRSKGSLLWHTFPQEAIDMIAEETGSQPVRLAVPSLVDGEIEFDADGRVFLVERSSDGNGDVREERTLLLQVNGHGEVFRDGRRVSRVHPFPMRDGRGRIENGQLVFDGIPQRPTTVASTRPS